MQSVYISMYKGVKKWVVLVLLYGLPAGFQSVAFAQALKPNIIMILADDLGYGELSSNDLKDCRTPTPESLRRAGRKFTNFY